MIIIEFLSYIDIVVYFICKINCILLICPYYSPLKLSKFFVY